MSLTQLTGQAQLSQNIYFHSDDHSLDEYNEKVLKEFTTKVGSHTESYIHIVGHTDQDGSTEYNFELSKKRALTVKTFLENEGFPKQDLALGYKGEQQLIHESTDEESKKENRRVTLIAETYSYNNIQEMLDLLGVDNENRHSIDTQVETKLTLNKGTEVCIPANAFCHKDGIPISNTNVELVFKEAFNYLDMMDQELYTQTEDAMLETGGMLYIQAIQEGQELILREGMTIDLTYPAQKELKNMELFVGVENNENGDGVTWEATGQEIKSKTPERSYFQVDMTPLLEYEFNAGKEPTIKFDEMPKCPKKLQKPYPPSKRIYSQDEYKVVYEKYQLKLEAYHQNNTTYDAKYEDWINEVEERKRLIRGHYRKMKHYYRKKRIIAKLQELESRQASESHYHLLRELFGDIYKVDKSPIPFDKTRILEEAFQTSAEQVKKRIGIKDLFNNENHYGDNRYYPDPFIAILRGKKNETITGTYNSGLIINQTLSNYVFSTPNLGWINCDRFRQVPDKDKTQLQLTDVESHEKHFMIFDNINSILRPRNRKGIFKGLPKGEAVVLLGIKIIENQPYIAKHEITTGRVQEMELQYEKSTFKKLKEIILKASEG